VRETGLLDTSVIIDWDEPEVLAALPDDAAVCTITLAELAAGPHLASDATERARRQHRLQQVESMFDPIPFDATAARLYGEVVAAAVSAGRRHRGRVADLLIASVAAAHQLALYTRNPRDFAALGSLVTVQGI
jgi:predicted nucleic acid-binding protein